MTESVARDLATVPVADGVGAVLPGAVLPVSVDELEALMRAHPPVEIVPVHRFAEGLYAREITIPAGTLLTGKIHRTQHLNVVSAGRISVWTEGDGMRTMTAPYTFVAQPGTRRVGLAHEDTVWTTIHATNETDLDALEAALIVPNDAPHDTPELALGIQPPEALCRG